MTECPVCYNRDNLGSPRCGHIICHDCSKQVDKCPKCRDIIVNWKKIFFDDIDTSPLDECLITLEKIQSFSSKGLKEIMDKRQKAKEEYLMIKTKTEELKKEIKKEAELELKKEIDDLNEIIGGYNDTILQLQTEINSLDDRKEELYKLIKKFYDDKYKLIDTRDSLVIEIDSLEEKKKNLDSLKENPMIIFYDSLKERDEEYVKTILDNKKKTKISDVIKFIEQVRELQSLFLRGEMKYTGKNWKIKQLFKEVAYFF